MWKLILPLVSLFPFSAAHADEYDFLAEPSAQEEVVIDPITQWPHKIILDATNRKLMFVWFDQSPPTSSTISFDDVQTLYSIPSQMGLASELQLETNSGAHYVVAYSNAGIQQQSLLMSALLGTNIQGNTDQALRISNEELHKRPDPKLVVGSISDPNALVPTGPVVEDKLLHSSAVGEGIGEDLPEKSTGALSRASVEIEIKGNMARFRGCYQQAIGRSPDIQGTVQIQFSVGKGGLVSGARIASSTLQDALAERCMLRHMYGLRFSEPKGGTAIFTYPFTFTRRD